MRTPRKGIPKASYGLVRASVVKNTQRTQYTLFKEYRGLITMI